ncbi:MAG TPA: trehalose-phosphatase [Bacteroidota bacterium]|nr:trehalose-phosphatase [Bacteroidota bacterium]
MTQSYLLDPGTWKNVCRKIRPETTLNIFLDFDGTLVPIRKRPSEAILSADARSVLRQLSESVGTRVSIVTGRSLADIRSLVKLDTILFASNHGLEIADNRSYWRHPDIDECLPPLIQFRKQIQRKLRGVAGLSIEDKGITFSVHYRGVNARDIPGVKSVIAESLASFDHLIRITTGKKVIEARPSVPWNKGFAVQRILRMYPAGRSSAALYAGDDQTDEDAFAVLRSRAITIRVGFDQSSRAAYYVDKPSDLIRAMKTIVTLRTNMIGET